MEKYGKFKKHSADTYAKLIAEALEAQGTYEADKHDTMIVTIAPLFVRLEEAREQIRKDGLVKLTKSREGEVRYAKNPAVDIEMNLVDKIRAALRDLGLFRSPISKKAAAEDEVQNEERKQDAVVDGLTRLNDILGNITRTNYRKPNN